MHYTEQYHKEFDRIFVLIQKSLPQQFSFNFDGVENRIDFSLIKDEWQFYDTLEKINILAPIFTAKDKKGEWILKEGREDNPDYWRFTSPIYAEYKFPTAFAVSRGNKAKTLSDLFRTNCIPANDEEKDKKQIEELKIITW